MSRVVSRNRKLASELLPWLLILAPAIVAASYAALEWHGTWDRITGRDLACDGLRRLKSAAGYPTSWIYDGEKDQEIFHELERRISRRTADPETVEALRAESVQPSS